MTTEASAISPPAIMTVRGWAATGRGGAWIVVAAAVAFSTAGLFTRLITADVWTMLFWRGVFGGLLIASAVIWQERGSVRTAFASIGWAGALAAGCSTCATICFIVALRETTVADVTVLYATAPFLAAAIAWVWIREKPRAVTLLASGLALLGVVAMSGGALSRGQVLGDALALIMTALMALMMVVIRRNRHVSMLPASCLSAFACSVLVLPLAHPGAVSVTEFGWFAAFGTSQFGLGLLLLTVGSRLVSPARTSLLANLELPFAPLWVWMAFGEVPSLATCVGGSVVLAAVLLDLASVRGQ